MNALEFLMIFNEDHGVLLMLLRCATLMVRSVGCESVQCAARADGVCGGTLCTTHTAIGTWTGRATPTTLSVC
jgi:hypothetical protein